jgi:stress response protein YsnF
MLMLWCIARHAANNDLELRPTSVGIMLDLCRNNLQQQQQQQQRQLSSVQIGKWCSPMHASLLINVHHDSICIYRHAPISAPDADA